MRALYNQRCGRCGTSMMYVQRRGDSGGTWACPVCGSIRRLRCEDSTEPCDDRGPTNPKPYADAA
ncbi:MAG TPA: hypothetical protein VNL36_03345 [Bacteroidota bacterium]|nr:hypothetical protein [Bacteroidota bacterium]